MKSYAKIPDPEPTKIDTGFKLKTSEWIVLLVLQGLLCFFIGIIVAHADAPFAVEAGNYPKQTLTPGVTRTVTLKTLCTPNSTKDARHVTEKMKKEVFTRYGLLEGKFKPGDYEIDHFISLENGGANDIMNLWPQKYCPIGNDPLKSHCWGAREKDKVETQLHRWLCQKKITLHDDQTILQSDWVACYMTMQSGKVCKP
jgi:hypothetical protein